MASVIILEDDEYIRNNLTEILEKKMYDVLPVDSVKTFWKAYEKKNADIYLIDVMLGDGNGFEVCEKLRRETEAPIIFLTSCDSEEDIIKGLDIGADDYITKPFRIAELMSRMQANLRRVGIDINSKQEQMDAELFIDVEKFIIKKQGVDISLTPTEWQLITILIANKGLIVKREVLLAKLWDNSGNFVEDNTLSVAVSRLKNKLGKDYIETIRGIGYRWIG